MLQVSQYAPLNKQNVLVYTHQICFLGAREPVHLNMYIQRYTLSPSVFHRLVVVLVIISPHSDLYFSSTGLAFTVLFPTAEASLDSCCARRFLMYRKSSMNTSSIRSFDIIRRPWTITPLSSCGPMPLNSRMIPSFSTMWRRTSVNDLNGRPFRSGGGLDWRPTLATMRGCVVTVAADLDSAPSRNESAGPKTGLFGNNTTLNR